MEWAEPECEVIGLTWRQKFALKRIIWKAWLKRVFRCKK